MQAELTQTMESSSQSRANTCVPVADISSTLPVIRRHRETKQAMAKVYRLKTGNFAVFVTLKAPIALKGCETIGRKKFEFSTKEAADSLAVDINTLLLGKQPARSLTPQQLRWAEKLFWHDLTNHPEWAACLHEMVAHCEATDFRPADKHDRTVAQAAHIFFQEKVAFLEYESWMNYRNALAYALPALGFLKTTQFTEKAVVKLSNGSEPLEFLKCTGHRTQTKEQRQEALWSTKVISKSKRPWTPAMKERFLRCMRAFKTWMHTSIDPATGEPRNWCLSWNTAKEGNTSRKLHHRSTKVDTELIEQQCRRNPALSVEQCQAIIDVAWQAYDGKFAAFYVHSLFGGTRVKETKRTKPDAYDCDDGVLTVAATVAKTDKARESDLTPNTVIMIEMLLELDLYNASGMRPTQLNRNVIAILAGFQSNNQVAQHYAHKERLRLQANGIQLPSQPWGVILPRNALRRTGLSMHYKLFKDVTRTTDWAGNTGKIFADYYKRLVKKEDARRFWTMIPSVIHERLTTAVPLPQGHCLDSVVSPETNQALVDAKRLAQQIQSDALKAAEARKRERKETLRLRTLVYRKRSYLKQKAAKASQRLEQPDAK